MDALVVRVDAPTSHGFWRALLIMTVPLARSDSSHGVLGARESHNVPDRASGSELVVRAPTIVGVAVFSRLWTELILASLCPSTLYELQCDSAVAARKKRVLQLLAKRFTLQDIAAECFRLQQ